MDEATGSPSEPVQKLADVQLELLWEFVGSGAGTPQHGLSSNNMALITSNCGKICSPVIKWP